MPAELLMRTPFRSFAKARGSFELLNDVFHLVGEVRIGDNGLPEFRMREERQDLAFFSAKP